MPMLSSGVRSLKPSVFATLGEKMKRLPQPPIPLHIGDTQGLPCPGARWSQLPLPEPEIYRYSHPFGLPSLLEALVEKLRRCNGLEVSCECLQVTCGATQALHCALQTLIEPGQAVLLLAPYWPLFGGMVSLMGATAVEVECTPRLAAGDSLPDILSRAMNSRVKAIYFSNPNNPDGYVYSADELAQLARFAQEHDLWVFSDECYEHYLYEGRSHRSLAALPGMLERTVSAFSFSKSYALAGHRLGYAVAQPQVMSLLRRVANHTVYNVSPSIQRAGLAALAESDSFCQVQLAQATRSRQALSQALRVPAPAGGAYCFPRFASPEAAWDFLERALEAGVALAPGTAFGEAFADRLRICFTCVEPPQLEQACQILASLG